MTWTEKNKPAEPVKPEREDILNLTKQGHVRILYDGYPMVWFSVDLPHPATKILDANDREGTRRKVLRELLPLAEAALTALRQAVAETEADEPAAELSALPPDAPLDMVALAHGICGVPEHNKEPM